MRRLILAGLLIGLTSVTAAAASFTPLGFLSESDQNSEAWGVSGDGSVVVGTSYTKAFRWTANDGMQALGSLPGGGGESYGWDVSSDGQVIVGISASSIGQQPFRWTATVGLEGLGQVDSTFPQTGAYGISGDGGTVVGYGGSNPSNSFHAFRWTSETGIQDINGNNWSSFATDASHDGSVIVGSFQSTSSAATEAFRWTASAGLVALFDGEAVEGAARAISADGEVIVGNARPAVGAPQSGFRWTVGTGLTWFETLPPLQAGYPASTQVLDTCADGSVAVGQIQRYPLSERAAVWTAPDNPQLLFDYLIANGATGLNGWTLMTATAISADCGTVIGIAAGPGGQQAFVADLTPIPVPSAVWLLSSTLVALAALRRRQAQAWAGHRLPS